jgi:recombination DNA repair RAD52 pathway protein
VRGITDTLKNALLGKSLTHCSTSTHALRELSKYEDEKTFRNIENNIREHLNIDLYVNEEAFEFFLILPSYEWIKGDR